MAPPLNLPELLVADGYPGIDVYEWPVLRDWLALYGQTYDELELNVRLGDGQATAPTDSESTKRMWRAVTQVRADLIAWRGHDADVVEAKVNATIEATTQVRRYARLLASSRRVVGRVTPVIICRTCSIGVEVSMHISAGRAERIPATS